MKSGFFNLGTGTLAIAAAFWLAIFVGYQILSVSGGCIDTRPLATLATATALESAVNNFHSEYGKLPDVSNRVVTDTAEGIQLLTILLGLEDSRGNKQNQQDVKFLSVKEGSNKKRGLIYSPDGKSVEGLFDAWGNPYVVEIDTTNQNHLHFKIGSKSIDLKGRRVAVYSAGPDRKLGTSDDVLNW